MIYEETVRIIKKKKRLVFAERIKFIETRQDLKESMIQYVHWLKEL